jgi:hypothetical protein
MKNIHIIATPNPSRLAILGMSNTLQLFDNLITFKTFGRSPQNIYITSDEEIKVGDWIILDNSIKELPEYQGLYAIQIFDDTSLKSAIALNCPKIILTTDQELIKDNIQAIDDEFLEWFVKNPSCEFVEVDRDEREVGNHLGGVVTEYGDYKIIIPKEEAKQDEIDFIANELAIEKEMFELEQELDIPSNLRWHNSKPKKRLEKYSERFDNKDNELVEGVFNPENWGKRLVKEEPDYTALLKPVGTWQETTLEEAIGKKAVDYCKQYEGTDKYNVAMLAIEFGYQLKLEEDEK